MASHQKYYIIMVFLILVAFIMKIEARIVKVADLPEILKELIPAKKGPGITLKSTAFAHLKPIPPDYTPDGNDASPALTWTVSNAETLKKTKSFALICIDSDAPKMHMRNTQNRQGFVHWMLFNIPANYQQLPKGVPRVGNWENNMKQGKNDFASDAISNIGYRGPQPPPGSGVHHYHFVLMALDALLELGNSTTIEQLLDTIAKQSQVLDYGLLTGVYSKD